MLKGHEITVGLGNASHCCKDTHELNELDDHDEIPSTRDCEGHLSEGIQRYINSKVSVSASSENLIALSHTAAIQICKFYHVSP